MRTCLTALFATLLGCTACSPPPDRDEALPEPQATALRDAIQAPIDTARGVEGLVQEADAARRKELDGDD